MSNGLKMKLYKALALLGVVALIKTVGIHGNRVIINTSVGLYEFTEVFEGEWQVSINSRETHGIHNAELVKLLEAV